MSVPNKNWTNKVPGYIQYNQYCGLNSEFPFFLIFVTLT